TDKIANTTAIFNNKTGKLQNFANKGELLFKSLKDNKASLDLVIDNLTVSSTIIKNTGTDLQKSANGLGTGINKISVLNHDTEKRLNKLLDEIDSFNQLLKKQRKSLAEAQKTSSKNKSD
nr:hypothetical protein [Desulfobacterales bacterium]